MGLFHPLCGADPITLGRVLRTGGGLSGSGVLPGIIAGLASVAQTPLMLGEAAFMATRPKSLKHPPIFILGHWRSGTTHLYNVLSKGPDFGYVDPFVTGLPWDYLTLSATMKPLLAKMLPKDRYIDNVEVNPDSPQEDEIALANLQDLSFYHAIYFPRRFPEWFDKGVFLDGASDVELKRWENALMLLYRKLERKFDGRPLLIKNPVYTARVNHLLKLFPDAKFIHIHRNPYKVFLSTQKFYRVLFEELSLQGPGPSDLDPFILATYTRMMNALIDDTAHLPSERYVEFSYDELMEQPMASLEHIYTQIDLGDFKAAAPAFEAYLATVRDYKKGVHEMDPGIASQVTEAWRPFIERWGYDVPD